MHLLKVELAGRPDKVQAAHHDIWWLLAAWWKNGQVLGKYPVTESAHSVTAYVQVPEPTALYEEHTGSHVREFLDKLTERGLTLRTTDLGRLSESGEACACTRQTWMILRTDHLRIEPPLMCGVCEGYVPLYRFSHPSGEHYDLKCWEADYQACDTLQMHCATGERFGTSEMSRVDSSLTKRGLDICAQLTDLSGVVTYYYLYRYNGRSLAVEERRLCPGCGGQWLLAEPVAGDCDMKCDRCRLVSNIAWNVRSSWASE